MVAYPPLAEGNKKALLSQGVGNGYYNLSIVDNIVDNVDNSVEGVRFSFNRFERSFMRSVRVACKALIGVASSFLLFCAFHASVLAATQTFMCSVSGGGTFSACNPSAISSTAYQYLAYYGSYPSTSVQFSSGTASGGSYSMVNEVMNGWSWEYFATNSGAWGGPLGDGYYWIRIDFNGDTYLDQYRRLGGVWSHVGVDTDTTTRFISVVPQNATTTATTTSVGSHLYVNENDYDSDIYLRVMLENQSSVYCFATGVALDFQKCNQSGSFGLSRWTVDFPLVSGDNDVSTTSPQLMLGRWTAKYVVYDPRFFGVWNDVLISTTTSFLVSTSTSIDLVLQDVRASLASTSQDYFSSCNPISNWDFMKCLSGATTFLFIPQSNDIQETVDSLYNDFLTRFPVGYITRFVSILRSTASTTPPAISYTFGSSSPQMLQGLTYSIQIYDHFGELTTITSDDGENKNIWDIINPVIQVLVALGVLYVILDDLLGFGINRLNEDVDDRYYKKGLFEKSTTERIDPPDVKMKH